MVKITIETTDEEMLPEDIGEIVQLIVDLKDGSAIRVLHDGKEQKVLGTAKARKAAEEAAKIAKAKEEAALKKREEEKQKEAEAFVEAWNSCEDKQCVAEKLSYTGQKVDKLFHTHREEYELVSLPFKVKAFDLEGKALIRYAEDIIVSYAKVKKHGLYQVDIMLKKILKNIKKNDQSVTKLKKAEIEKTIVIIFDTWVEEDPVKNQKMTNDVYAFERDF